MRIDTTQECPDHHLSYSSFETMMMLTLDSMFVFSVFECVLKLMLCFVYDVVIFSRDRVQEAEKVLTETES